MLVCSPVISEVFKEKGVKRILNNFNKRWENRVESVDGHVSVLLDLKLKRRNI